MSVELPPIGTVRNSRGQPYTFQGDTKAHVTRKGSTVTLWSWLTPCADCGALAVAWASGDRPTHYCRRRCDPCAAVYTAIRYTPAERLAKRRERGRAKSQRYRDRAAALRSIANNTKQKD